MNVRGERILIFGDSLTHHGADAGPEVWNVDAGSSRTSSAPGDLLASLLLEQGAAAVRTDARVGRSAANFYERENATALLDGDKNWRPTKVVIMLGTNDIGRDVGKTTAAMAGLKNAFELAGAEVWAIGPMTYNVASLNQQAPQVVQVMANVFGARFIDARNLSVQTGRARDGVHFGQDAARQTALNLANVLMSKSTTGDLLGAMLLGAGLAMGAIALYRMFASPAPVTRRGVLEGLFTVPQHPGGFAGVLALPASADEDDDEFDEPEDLRAMTLRFKREKAERKQKVNEAFEKSNAVILTLKDGQRKLAIKTPEMSNKDEGKIRVTYFGEDGPIGHATRKSMNEIVEDVIDYFPVDVKPATEIEVMKWTGTDEFAEGARRVAEVQRANAGLKGTKRKRA